MDWPFTVLLLSAAFAARSSLSILTRLRSRVANPDLRVEAFLSSTFTRWASLFFSSSWITAESSTLSKCQLRGPEMLHLRISGSTSTFWIFVLRGGMTTGYVQRNNAATSFYSITRIFAVTQSIIFFWLNRVVSFTHWKDLAQPDLDHIQDPPTYLCCYLPATMQTSHQLTHFPPLSLSLSQNVICDLRDIQAEKLQTQTLLSTVSLSASF